MRSQSTTGRPASFPIFNTFKRSAAVLAAAAGLFAASTALAGTWTRLVHNAPAAVNLMLLLPDGTVMAANNDGGTIRKVWYRLTPDSTGSYVNGTWSTRAAAHDTRLYCSSQVLKDGRVLVAGGEYGTGAASAELYDPVANSWRQVNPAPTLLDPSQASGVISGPQAFLDSNSEILPDGRVLICPVGGKTPAQTLYFNPTSGFWGAGPNLANGVYQDESSWVKLPDDSILTIDPFGQNSERFIPSMNAWINDSLVPINLYDPFGFELGAGFLLPNGNAFYLGSTGHTAIYMPSGSTAPGIWIAGPDIPGSHGTPDAPAAMMVTGNILCAVSPLPTAPNHFPSPTSFYEYDPVANSFTATGAPNGSTDGGGTFTKAMLDLPDGSVLYSHMSTDLYVYRPTGAPLAAGKPVISTITQNLDGTFHLTGMGLNGISEGAAYGDDLQMASNYPLVRITHTNGNIYYARTFNWSSTSVMTGTQVVTTEFALPAGFPAGDFTLVAVANGIASDPVAGCASASVNTGPTMQSACLGGSASFTVGATGSGTLAYQWRRGTTNLSNGGNISGVDTGTLVINPVTLADAGDDYNCLVSNVCGNGGSASASLLVNGPSVSIVQTPAPGGLICEGLNLTLSASSQCAANPTFQWFVDLNPIDGQTQSTLMLAPITAAQSGSYTCLISYDGGSVMTDAIAISVDTAPSIQANPEGANSCRAGTAVLSVAAGGTAPTYQWRRFSVPLVDQPGHIAGSTTSELTLTTKTNADAGFYDCVLTNQCGTATSLTAEVVVCIADFNCSDTVTVQDIFDFLTVWFAHDVSADINASGSVTVQDIFDFLAGWFARC